MTLFCHLSTKTFQRSSVERSGTRFPITPVARGKVGEPQPAGFKVCNHRLFLEDLAEIVVG